MTTWVKIIAALMILEGIIALLSPGFFRATFQKVAGSWILYIVAGLYAVIGMVMLLAAAKCHYPPLVIALGILTSLMAITMFALHQNRLSAFFQWLAKRGDITIRILAILEAALGLSLIFAA